MKAKITALALACLSTSVIANEQSTDEAQTQAKKGKWTFGVGVMGARIPHYPGAEQSKKLLIPFPYINYKSEKLTIDRTGVVGKLYKAGNWDLTWSGNASIKVASEDNRARSGMPDLGWVAATGPALNWRLDDSFYLQWTARKAFAYDDEFNSIGWQGEMSANWGTKPKAFYDLGKAAMVLKTKVGFGSSDYNDYLYAVDSQYATTDRPAYHASSGYTGTQLLAGFELNTSKYRTGLFIRYHHIGGASFEESPLVKQSGNLSFGFAFAWILSD
jgi:outer membrane scaffolding protein for murein synthesis (MipA/OmpV family)